MRDELRGTPSWFVMEMGGHLEEGGSGGAVFGFFCQALGHKVVEKKRPGAPQSRACVNLRMKDRGFFLAVANRSLMKVDGPIRAYPSADNYTPVFARQTVDVRAFVCEEVGIRGRGGVAEERGGHHFSGSARVGEGSLEIMNST